MRKLAKINPSALLLALTLGAVCVAQDVKTSAAERDFRRFDSNESGWLSGKELVACQCKSYDKDGDDEVTKTEFFAGRGVGLRPGKPSGDDDEDLTGRGATDAGGE